MGHTGARGTRHPALPLALAPVLRRPAHTPSALRREGKPLTVGFAGASVGRGSGDSFDNLPEPPCWEHSKAASNCHYPMWAVISEEKPVWGGRGGKEDQSCRSTSLPFLVPAQSVTVTQCPGETLETAWWWIWHTHGRGLRAPETSAQSAWRSCKTALGHPATFWKHPH